MRQSLRRLLRRFSVLTLAVAVASCTEDSDPTRPLIRTSFTTPTGLVTANPPAIFVGAGDIGDCGDNDDEATAKLLDNIPGTVFALGDNAYDNGSDANYRNCYEPTWGRHKARTRPAPGNHDYNTSGASGYFKYFGAAAGEPGKGYYSFELGAWHVIVLNSNISMSAGSSQEKWLRADLASHPNLCTVAYWHHPLYSSTDGSGSGGTTYSSVRPLIDALYAGGADLVLGGHRHFYERLAPIKPDGRRDDAFGIREIVAGTGGIGGGTLTNIFPASEARNGNTFGVVKLYLYEDGYAWKFIPVAGRTFSDSGSTACHGLPGGGGGGGGVSAAQSTVSASPTTITASTGSSASTITVTAKDASGNPVSGATVVLSATGSGNTLTQPAGTTNASGVATGTLRSTVAAAKTVSATINGVAITQSATVTVTPAAASALAFTVQPSNTAPGATITPAVQVDVRDEFGNRVTSAAHNVTLAIGANPSAGTLSGTTTVAATAGVATFSNLSINNAGTGYTLTASASGLGGATSDAFNVAAGSVSTITHTLLTAGNDQGNHKVYTTAAIAPAPNTLITVAVVGHTSSSAPPSPTLSGGGMSAWTEVVSTAFDTGTLPLKRLTIFRALSAAPGSGPLTITFSTGLSNCQWIVSQWTGVLTSGVNGAGAIGQTGSSRGDGVSGLTVPLATFGNANNVAYGVFGVSASDAAVTPGAGFTEISEQPSAETPRSDLEAEWAANHNTIAATWTTLNAGALGVELRAASSAPGPGVSASQSTVTAVPSAIEAGSGTSTITVTVKDESGTPISGASVVLAATGSGNTLVQPAGPTDASGVATGTLSSTVAGTKTVSATANGTALTQTASVTVTAGAVSASQSTVTAAPSSIQVGSETSTITVTVKDAHGNPVSGANVVLAATGSGNTLTQPAGATGANGVATGTLSSTVAETKTVSATANGTALTQTAQVTVTAGAISASQSTLTAAPSALEAGNGTSTITVTVKDASGAPVSGATVVLAATGSGNTLTQPAGPTDASGVATGTLSSTVAGTKTVSATANGTALTQTATVTVTAGAVSANQSSVAAAPTSITAGSGTATITVTAKDANGNPVSGASVVLAATGSGNTLTQPAGPTGANGVATGTLSSTVAEPKTVSATANGTALTQTATVTVTAAGSGSTTITHTLLTAGNNTTNQSVYTTAAIAPAANTLITVAVLGHNSSSAPSSPTLSGGGMTGWTEVASVTFDPIGVPLKRLTIFRALSAAPGSGALTITFSNTESNCQWIVSQWAGVETSGVNGAGAVGQTGSNRGDAVSGLTVSLAAFGNGNNVAYGVFGVRSQVLAVTPGAGFTELSEQPSVETPAADLEAEWAPNRNTIGATWTTLNAGALGVELRAAGSGAGPGVSASQSTLTAVPSSIVAGSETSTITVTVKDASGAPVSGASVVLAATGSGNTLTQPAGPTDASGVATGTLRSTVAGTKTVSATANGTALTQTAQVTVSPGPASASASTISAAPTSITVGSGTSTITVTAKDAHGNPVGGASVVLAATGSGNTLTQPAGPTDANGVATGTLSSTMEETKTISATVNGTGVTQTATVTVTAQATSAITQTLLTAGNDPLNQKVYTTAAIAPAPNTLVTVAVLGHNSSTAPLSPTLSGGGMTAWTEVASITFDTGTLPLKRLTLFRALSAAPGSGPLTITFGTGGVSNCQWIVSQWAGVETSGVNGAGAIGQTGSAQGDAVSGLTVPLAAFGTANNVGYGVFGVRSQTLAVTPGTGFTEISEQPSAESPLSDLESEWAPNRNTVAATWTALNAGALGVEIKARPATP